MYLNGCPGDDCFWKWNGPYTFEVWLNTYKNSGSISFNGLNNKGGNVVAYLSDTNSSNSNLVLGKVVTDVYSIHKAIGSNGESKWFNNVNLNGNFKFTTAEIKLTNYVASGLAGTSYYNKHFNNNYLIGTVRFFGNNANSGGATSFGPMVSNGGTGGAVSVNSGNTDIYQFYIYFNRQYQSFSGGTYYPSYIYMYGALTNQRSGTRKGSGLISNFQYK